MGAHIILLKPFGLEGPNHVLGGECGTITRKTGKGWEYSHGASKWCVRNEGRGLSWELFDDGSAEQSTPAAAATPRIGTRVVLLDVQEGSAEQSFTHAIITQKTSEGWAVAGQKPLTSATRGTTWEVADAASAAASAAAAQVG